MKLSYVAAAAVILWAQSPSRAEATPKANFERAAKRVTSLVEATREVPGAAPAMALVIVAEGAEPIIIVSGTADMRTAAKADADTPFYIASMTKAYMGLLAAELDRRGVLDLDSTLGSHWPELRIPGVDTNAMTLRNLLTHRLLFTNSTLTFRTPYVGEVPVSDYPSILAAHSEPKQPGFSYDNLGYLLYGAILEKETGRSWKDWLDSAIFEPMGLTRISARTSDFPLVTAGHQWGGKEWHVTRAKSDSVMHPAGGLVTSARDMARWLQAQVQGHAKGISSLSFEVAQTAVSYPKDDRGGRICDGYTLGWNRCGAHGINFLEHGGGYTGFRSQMMIVPDRKIGFAVLTNSDSMTGGLTSDLMMEFVRALAGDTSHGPDPKAFAASYAEKVAKQAEGRDKRDAKDRADAKWQGWTWKPSPQELAAYAGRYRNNRLGDIVVRQHGMELVGTLGELTFQMIPAAPDLFAGILNPMEVREALSFERSSAGPTALLWEERRFERIP